MADHIRPAHERHLEQMTLEVEALGFRAGTPPFEATMRQKKVEVCQVVQQVPSCEVCPAFDACELIKQHLRDVRYGVER